MSVKAPRGLTHAKRLYAPEVWVDRITASWHELGNKPAVLLVQLAPDHARDDDRVRYFLSLLPSWLRVALEFRHPSWHHEDVFAMLEHHQAAYCVMSGARLPCVLRATAPLAYVRMHGSDNDHLYAGDYPDSDLAWWLDASANGQPQAWTCSSISTRNRRAASPASWRSSPGGANDRSCC